MYIDTSILTKLFSAEPDSEFCVEKTSGTFIVCSELAYGELFSALSRKERAGTLSKTFRERAWKRFEDRLAEQSIWLANLDGRTVRRAKDVMFELHPKVALRTFDAIHLATCLSVVAGPLFTADQRMREAAMLLKIPLVH